jgi:hypothetical protein
MRNLTCLIALVALGAGVAVAQRPVRVGLALSSISLQDGNGESHHYGSFGATLDLLTGDDGESGLLVSRYNDLSSTTCARELTFIGVNSRYYPIGAAGVAPFASTEIGLARVTEAQAPLLFSCTGSTPVTTTSQLGIAFGLGVRVGTRDAAATMEARFVQVPNSFVQGLEVLGGASVAFGRPRQTQLLKGTVGPAVSVLIPISGPLRGRGPLLGVRFRRDTKKSGSVGLQIDYAPLEVTGPCTNPGCTPHAVLFAPGYEASLYPRWGRVYGEIGALLAGFYEEGADRGVAQGAQAGLGADLYSGAALMWNLSGRLLWLQRNSGENVFAVQVGVSLSPRLEHHASGAIERN